VACSWLPHPRSAAPQSAYRVGQVDLYGHDNESHCSGPYSCVVPTVSGLTGWHHRQGMPGAPFPVGLCTLQVIHHVIPQPSTTSWGLVSPSWRLSGPCYSPRRVVCDAEAQGLIGYLYTRGCFHILPYRFHGAQRGTSGGSWRRLLGIGRCLTALSPPQNGACDFHRTPLKHLKGRVKDPSA
jgi:hypothetical protein